MAPERPTALPSPLARAVAFASIIVAGLCGGAIGYAFVDLQCTDGCGAEATAGALIGAVLAAGGVAIVAVLVLRAMGEWAADKRLAEADEARTRRPVGPEDRPDWPS